jgi:polygalacturonase
MRNSCKASLTIACASLVLAVGCVSRSPARNVGIDAPTSDAPGGGDGKPQSSGGVYLLNETFNEIATGTTPMSPWMTTASPQGAVTVVPTPFAVDHSAMLAKPDATGATSLAATFPAQSGRVVFEAKVMANETAGFKAIPYIYDSAGDAVASLAFQDGNIVAHIGATATTIQTFAAQQWYRVRLVIDTNAGTFDLFIDGIRQQHAVALRTAAGSVNSVRFYMDAANVGTLWVDNVEVYSEAAFIGTLPTPLFDAHAYGATGNGTTDDTAAIQAAINAAAGTGGTVVLTGGTFLSGTLTLASNLTFYVDSSAVLLGTTNLAGYPTLTPATGNTQLSNCQHALLYANAVQNVTIIGGGTIDGQGDSFTGVENTRPLLIWSVLSSNVSVRDLFLRKGPVWSLVTMETDNVVIDHVDVQSNYITHDGIDIVDGSNITVSHVAVNAGDDAMCLKSGVRRGIVGMTVTDSVFTGNNGGSNGIKIGTATYGAFTNISIQDSWVKGVQYAAMAVESRQGSDIEGLSFQRIEFFGTGAAFFVYLAQQSTTHPIGDVPKLGSIDNVSFTDIIGTTAQWANSPSQGSLITGQIYNGMTYAITNLAFTRASVVFDGGATTVPAAPPEATANQYPESNMFGDLPAWAYYLRHVTGVTFDTVTASASVADVRPMVATDDVSNMTGAPAAP